MGNRTERHVQDVIAAHASAMGLEIVAVELRKQSGDKFLRIFIARADGQIMDWETCEQFHRSIVDLLEEVEYDYLEVSSPGDRPLKTPQDYKRNLGQEVDVKVYAAINGQKLFTGILNAYDGQNIILECGNKTQTLPLSAVAQVKPTFRIE